MVPMLVAVMITSPMIFIGGIVMIAQVTERRRLERLLREQVKHATVVRISKGRRRK